MIKPINYDRGRVLSLPMTASTTLTKFNLVKMTSGYLVAGAGGDNEVEYVALETKTSPSSGVTYCEVLPISDDILFEALVSATPVQATHVGNDYDVETAASIDLGATTDKLFHIDEIVSATNKLVRGRFNKPALA
jgi:hypothetical protein